MKRFLLSMVVIFWASSVHAGNWYVDNAVISSGNGQSWTTAWKHISNIDYASVNAGDTIYISGGTTSKTYNESLGLPKSGSAGAWITISTGQESGHDGVVIMNNSAAPWISDGNLSYFHVTGNVNGARHMRVTGTNWRWWTLGSVLRVVDHVRLSYIEFPKSSGVFHFSNGGGGSSVSTHIELDHLYIEKIKSTFSDDVIYNLGGYDSPYDTNLVHDNEIYIPAWYEYGDDGIKWGSGISFYNNYIGSVKDITYTSGQHHDLMQLNKSYFKIYNNTFNNLGGAAIFHSMFGAIDNAVGVLIYNNLFVHSEIPSSVSRAISLVVFDSKAIGSTFTDFIVANNTLVDWTAGESLISMKGAASYTNCAIQNNVFKNFLRTTHIVSDAGVTVSNNSEKNSAVQFVKYKEYDVFNNNFRLAASDTVARDNGTTPAKIPAIDKGGVARAQGPAWDLGAYEFIGLDDTGGPSAPLGLQVK